MEIGIYLVSRYFGFYKVKKWFRGLLFNDVRYVNISFIIMFKYGKDGEFCGLWFCYYFKNLKENEVFKK